MQTNYCAMNKNSQTTNAVGIFAGDNNPANMFLLSRDSFI